MAAFCFGLHRKHSASHFPKRKIFVLDFDALLRENRRREQREQNLSWFQEKLKLIPESDLNFRFQNWSNFQEKMIPSENAGSDLLAEKVDPRPLGKIPALFRVVLR